MVPGNRFSLANSEYNDFLFAPVGDEGNGMTLSVISALTRLDIDPWREAARLACLSKERAVQSFVPIIERLPGGLWSVSDINEIAARLVALLPKHEIVPRFGAIASRSTGRPNAVAVLLLTFLACSAATTFIIGMHHQLQLSANSAPAKVAVPDTQSQLPAIR